MLKNLDLVFLQSLQMLGKGLKTEKLTLVKANQCKEPKPLLQWIPLYSLIVIQQPLHQLFSSLHQLIVMNSMKQNIPPNQIKSQTSVNKSKILSQMKKIILLVSIIIKRKKKCEHQVEPIKGKIVIFLQIEQKNEPL